MVSKRKTITTRDVAYVGMYLALFYVLDVLSNVIPLFKMPNGGTLGLGTIALLLASYKLGWKLGLLTGALSVLVQFVAGQMYLLGFVQFLLDYLIAFSAYGLACLFPNWKWFYSGILVTSGIRFLSSLISGVIFYGLNWSGSALYQATYMIPTIVLDMVLVPILVHHLPRLGKAH